MGPTEIYGSEHFTEAVGTKPTNAPFLRLRRKGGTLLEVIHSHGKRRSYLFTEAGTSNTKLYHKNNSILFAGMQGDFTLLSTTERTFFCFSKHIPQ